MSDEFWTDEVNCSQLCQSEPSGDLVIDGFATHDTYSEGAPVFGQTDVTSITHYDTGIGLRMGDVDGDNPALGPTVASTAATLVGGDAHVGDDPCVWISITPATPSGYIAGTSGIRCRPDDSAGYACTEGAGLAVPIDGYNITSSYAATVPQPLGSVGSTGTLSVSLADLSAAFGVTFDAGTNVPVQFHLIIEAGGYHYQACFAFHTCY